MNDITKYLSNRIKLNEYKKGIFISNQCPFDLSFGSNRRFRYNSHLKVGKCFHCGKSFKDISWLKTQIEKPNKARFLSMLNDTLYLKRKYTNKRKRERIIKQKIKKLKLISLSICEKSIGMDDYPF